MSVTMGELFQLAGHRVLIGRGLQATLQRSGSSVEVCFEGVGGASAFVVVQDGTRLGEESCSAAWGDARAFCPQDLDDLETDVVEIRTIHGLRRSRSHASVDAARLSA